MGQDHSAVPAEGDRYSRADAKKGWWSSRKSVGEASNASRRRSSLRVAHTDEAAGGQCRRRVLRIVVVGDHGCGKSSVVDRYCLGLYNIKHVPTVGPQLMSCPVTSKNAVPSAAGVENIVQFVELPIEEARSTETLALHTSNADGILFIADATRPASVVYVDSVLAKVKNTARPEALMCLFLHKSDRKSAKMPWLHKDAELEYAAAAGLCHVASTTAVSAKVIDQHMDVFLTKVIAAVERAELDRRSGALAPEDPSAADVGFVGEDKIKQVEGHVAAYLNVHTQVLGDYKKELGVSTGSTGRHYHNQARIDVSTALEHELLQACEHLFSRLRRLRSVAPLTHTADCQDFLAVSELFYCHLVPSWGLLNNELVVEATVAQARGLSKMKSGPVLKSAPQYTAMVQPPPMFLSYLEQLPDKPPGDEGYPRETAAQSAPAMLHHGSLSPDTATNFIGTSAVSASSNMLSSMPDSWEGAAMPVHGTRPEQSMLGLTPRFKDGSPPTSYPLQGVERRGIPSLHADRYFLKALSQNRLELKQLKDFLLRSQRDAARLHRQKSSGASGKHKVSRPRCASSADDDAHVRRSMTGMAERAAPYYSASDPVRSVGLPVPTAAG